MTNDDDDHFDQVALENLQHSRQCGAQRMVMALGEDGLLVVQSFHMELEGAPVAHVTMPVEVCIAGLIQQLQIVTNFCRQLNAGDPALEHVAEAIDVPAQMQRIWEALSEQDFKMENRQGEPIFRPVPTNLH